MCVKRKLRNVHQVSLRIDLNVSFIAADVATFYSTFYNSIIERRVEFLKLLLALEIEVNEFLNFTFKRG